MKLSALQLAVIAAGIALVIGVFIYNVWQERRVRRRIAAAFNPAAAPSSEAERARRIEPTLRGSDSAGDVHAQVVDAPTASHPPAELPASPFAIPMDEVSVAPDDGAQ